MRALRHTLAVLLSAAAALSFAGSANAQNNAAEKMTRSRALSRLKGCSRPRHADLCDEDDADFLIRLFWRGDTSLLKPLLDAGPYSDAALAEILGTFYEKVLEQHTRLFLRGLAPRPKQEQYELALAAGFTDGGGMSPKMLHEVRRNLRRVAAKRHDRLAPVARRCLAAIEEAARRTQTQ